MESQKHVVATVEEVRAIAVRAHDLLVDIINDEDPTDDESPLTRLMPLTFAALRFVALAAAELGDTSLFEVVADALSMRVAYDDDEIEGDIGLMRDAASELLSRGIRLNEHVSGLAEESDANVRRMVAAGLKPAGAPEIALLRKLAKDADRGVRNAARESLRDVAEVPWWEGKFSVDPESLVPASELARARPILQRVAALMDVEWFRRSASNPELLRLARRLPADVAADLAEHAMLAFDSTDKASIVPFAKLVLAGSGADAALDRLFAHWTSVGVFFAIKDGLTGAFQRLPSRRRHALCLRLARVAIEAPASERATNDSAAVCAAQLAAAAWPRNLDARPVFEAIAALTDERELADDDEDEEEKEVRGHDLALGALSALLERVEPRPGPLLARFVEARLDLGARPLRALSPWITTHLERLDARALRPIAERAAASTDDAAIGWGLGLLVGALHDPHRDPPVSEMFRAWVSQPRLRRALAVAVGGDLCRQALPHLRAALRAGTLDRVEAGETMVAIDFVYGGLVDWEWKQSPKSRPALQRSLGRLLGPKPLRGAITGEEWSAYRAARDREDGEEPTWHRALVIVPPGAWDESDRALFARALAATVDGEAFAFQIAATLAAKPDAEALAMLDALLEVVPGEDRDFVRKARVKVAKALGVAIKAAASSAAVAAETLAAAAPVPSGDWMDEPEEEEAF